MSLSSSIDFHRQPCSKGSGLHQAPHVCVIPWVPSELVQGLVSFAHMILPVMCISSGCKCLSIFHSLCHESCLVSHDVSIYCMMELRTSLQVLILHPRHHSSWTGLPFLLGYFFISERLYINDVSQQCHITTLCLRFLFYLKVLSYYSSSWILSWTVVTCSSEQVSSLFSCRWLYNIFPTSQMHQLYH